MRTWAQAGNFEHKHHGPFGWIQWKGTDVCMDVYCKCGAHLHFDTDFLYAIECGNCGTFYRVDPHVQLIEFDGKNGLVCHKQTDPDFKAEAKE